MAKCGWCGVEADDGRAIADHVESCAKASEVHRELDRIGESLKFAADMLQRKTAPVEGDAFEEAREGASNALNQLDVLLKIRDRNLGRTAT